MMYVNFDRTGGTGGHTQYILQTNVRSRQTSGTETQIVFVNMREILRDEGGVLGRVGSLGPWGGNIGES